MLPSVPPTPLAHGTNESNLDQKFWDYFNVNIMEATQAVNFTTAANVTPSPEQGFIVGMYSTLLVIGAVGNVAVFTSLVRSRRRKSRVNLLMTHLAIADLIVTFFCIPLEIGWRTTNEWLAGNIACKFFQVIRAFGLYLSSNVLVCISLDRFFAVLYPLRLPIARKRSKTMLSLAWIIALLSSMPQSLVFRVMPHPNIPDFEQCVSFYAFSSVNQELAYNVLCLSAMYFLPLLIITVCYSCIFYEISKNSSEISDTSSNESDRTRIHLRRSDERPLARARRRTLRMTVTIVSVFACCWLPYATMTLWYMLDRSSAELVSSRVQDLFFMMAVSNSCMDPLVYGSYALSVDVRNFLRRAFRKILCLHIHSPEMPGVSAPGTLKSKVQTIATTQPENGTSKRSQRCAVRFEETSFIGPSACSDPSPYWSERLSDIDHNLYRMRSSQSCDVFNLHTTPKRLRVSFESADLKTYKFSES